MSEALREVRVAGAGYPVRIGAGALGELEGVLEDSRAQVVADTHVLQLHGGRLPGALRERALALPRGEAAKDWSVVGDLLERLASTRLDRASCLVSFGGGAACDATGLAAALYLRGVAVLHCPTTLLAQVDASVGGKTAVNLPSGKNLAGTFWPPRAVLCDTELLATLEHAEWLSGLGEVLKMALLDGEAALVALEDSADALVRGEGPIVVETVARCVGAKARVVAADEREAGPRRTLNLGHTFAHAIERAAGFGRIPHGVAVAAGVGLALEASARFGVLEDPALPERVAALANRLGLPAGLGALRAAEPDLALDAAELGAAMGHDKKGRAGRPLFVGVARVGAARGDLAWGEAEIERLLVSPAR